jgi:tetratricopeptide (TPR) repeat protein
VFALVLMPAITLLVLEAALRVIDYGYPTTYFLSRWQHGQFVLVENSRFGFWFFSSSAARNPAPVVLSARKAPGTYRIFLFGESAALGDPRPAYGMGRYLQVLLQERFSGMRFEVVCVAMTAINSHAIRLIAEECAQYEGDLWLVYMGNNEMVGPYGAATIFGPRAPGLWYIRANLWLKATRIGQWMKALGQTLEARRHTETVWKGMRLFLDNQISPDDPRRQKVAHHFSQNLADIIAAGQRAHCQIILSTVACNLKDCAPFGSLHRSNLSSEMEQEWKAKFQTGVTQEAASNWESALTNYLAASMLDSEYAELQFRLGRCYAELHKLSAARQAFTLARDYDTLPFRADSAINDAIKLAADRNVAKGVVMVDADQALSDEGRSSIPGNESFFEHVHLNLESNYQLARAFATAVERLMPSGFRRSTSPDWASESLCHRDLGLTEWNQYTIYDSVRERTSAAPFTGQMTHPAQSRFLLEQLERIKARRGMLSTNTAAAIYRDALTHAPSDFRLHENYAEFLEAIGAPKAALEQWQAVRDLLPHYYVGYFQVGRLMARQDLADQAEANLRTAIKLEPRSAEAHQELGKLFVRQSRFEAAAAEYAEAEKWQPDNARICLALADALARTGKRAEAMDVLRRAVRAQPTFWEAHYLLGVELAMVNRIPEAQWEFQQAVRLRPNHALAHLNLGVALIRQGQIDATRHEFEVVLSLDPLNQPAKQHLNTIESLAHPTRKN